MDKIRLSLNSSSMSPFSMFALLYMTAYFVEIVDPAGQVAQGMQGQIFALASVLVLTITVLTSITRVKFLVFLYLATAALLSAPFPGVPNHANIMIYCNVLMIVATIYSFARYRSFATDNDYFEMVRPVLGASLILVYCLAGFNKLNSDSQAGRTVPLVLEYRGGTYSTEDIVKDPVWRTEKRNWEMMLLDFRDIQPEGPNQCRW